MDTSYFINRRERVFEINNSYFSVDLPKKIDFFIWDNQNTAESILGKPLGFAFVQYAIVHSTYNQTAGHELTHVLINFMNGFKKTTGFISEGVAICFDHSKRNFIAQAKNAVKTGGLQKIDIKSLWVNFDLYPDHISYPIAAAFIYYLIKTGGKKLFLELCKCQEYSSAKKLYGDKLDEIIYHVEQMLIK